MSQRRAALIELAQLDKSDLAQALRRTVEITSGALDVERVSYWDLERDHSGITCRVLYRQAADAVDQGAKLLAADFPAYFGALLACRTIVADDAATDPHTSELAEIYFRPNGITSMLDIPVWLRGRLAGVLCLEHVGPLRTWTRADQDFALCVGNMVSVALESVERQRVEEGYTMLARVTDDVFWDWDIATGVIQFSNTIVSRLGFTGAGQHDINWWADRVHAEDRARVKEAVQCALNSSANDFSVQYRFICGDGRVAKILDRGYIARNEHGCAIRMVGSMLDVTERVSLEERLEMSERLASIGRLAAGVAHEINNPLTYILSNLSSAIDALGTAAPVDDAVVEMLGDAREGAERVRRIVRDLQALSRSADDDVEPVDVREVIESSIKVAWNEIRHRARLVQDFGPVMNVAVDRARLGQVILNLLINAAQAIPDGAADRHHIRISTRSGADGRVAIEIADTGAGIPVDLRPRIFEPFFTTKPVGTGTGLGLAICHSIITRFGGDLEVDTAPEGGCLMRVSLPGTTAARPRAPSASQIAAIPRSTVLVVDDEPRVRRVLCRMLGGVHDVVEVESGHAALERLLHGPPVDVILCDLMMPHMTGMDLLERLAERAPAYVERMIFMTGGAFSERACALVTNGRHLVLEKPVESATLLSAVREITAGSRGERATRRSTPAPQRYQSVP